MQDESPEPKRDSATGAELSLEEEIRNDPLLRLFASGKGLWPDPDEFVRQIREGWDEAAKLRENPPQPPDTPSNGPEH